LGARFVQCKSDHLVFKHFEISICVHLCSSVAEMKAVILAAGKGTRMRDLTNRLPKPMLRHKGKPILEHIVTGILAAGIRNIFIVTGWRAEVIETHFGDGTEWAARIVTGRQVVQDGTGKAPELAKKFVGNSPFLLTYGDILVPRATYPQILRRFKEGDFAGVVTVGGAIGTTAPGRLAQAQGPRLVQRRHLHLPAFPLRLHRQTAKIAAR
jgi:NDP-sugar pyrophosphorylase family protein